MLVEMTPDKFFRDYSDSAVLFFKTETCGTCKLAEQMLEIAAAADVGPANVFVCHVTEWQDYAEKWKVSSVPCLIHITNGEPDDKIYRMESVPRLYEWLKNVAIK